MLQEEIKRRINGPIPKAKKLIYLCGPMEYAKNFGVNWRNDITPRLLKAGYSVFNPCNEVKLFNELKALKNEQHKKVKKFKGKEQVKEIQATFKDLQKAENLDIPSLMNQFSKVIKYDLKEVIASDLILCQWEQNVFSAGSSGELTVAKLFNIPVLMVCSNIISLPKWILGCITKYTGSLDNIEEEIKSII